jgi:putative hydrolase of the HAD superfamily
MSRPQVSCSSAEAPIEAVLFDLDDTLYPQDAWLAGAWEAVAHVAECFGVDKRRLLRALHAEAGLGSDRGCIIDAALAAIGAGSVPVRPLVETFRHHHADRLWPFPGACEALRFLSSRVRVGLVTDGDPVIQRGKLRALGLEHAFDVVVFSDELGRSMRKPHPAALVRAARILGLDRAACIYVGDRPSKDVAAAAAARMRAVRVRTGEYRSYPDFPRPWRAARDVPDAVRLVLPLLAPPARRSNEIWRDHQPVENPFYRRITAPRLHDKIGA